MEQTVIVADDVNRPGLQLAGFFDYFGLQPPADTRKRLKTLFSIDSRPRSAGRFSTSCCQSMCRPIIISRGIDPYPECLENGEKIQDAASPVIDRDILPRQRPYSFSEDRACTENNQARRTR